MADEEKKGEKQVVLPYSEYQEMERKIADNSIDLTVKVKFDDGYPMATISDMVCHGSDKDEIKQTFRRCFSDILHRQIEWVESAKASMRRMDMELAELRNKKCAEQDYLRRISTLNAEADKLASRLKEAKQEKDMWKYTANTIIFICTIAITLLLVFR